MERQVGEIKITRDRTIKLRSVCNIDLIPIQGSLIISIPVIGTLLITCIIVETCQFLQNDF